MTQRRGVFLSMIPHRNKSTKHPHPISLQILGIVLCNVSEKKDLSMEFAETPLQFLIPYSMKFRTLSPRLQHLQVLSIGPRGPAAYFYFSNLNMTPCN